MFHVESCLDLCSRVIFSFFSPVYSLGEEIAGLIDVLLVLLFVYFALNFVFFSIFLLVSGVGCDLC